MMKQFIAVMMILVALHANAQDTILGRPKNGIHLEILGVAPLLSINYQRVVLQRKHFFISDEAGAGLFVEGGIVIRRN